MSNTQNANSQSIDIALRAHDVTVCLERTTVPEFDQLQTVGMAARLALHLRGVQAVKYDLVRLVAIYLLNFPGPAVRPVLEFLAEAEFVQLVTEGRQIRTVIPIIPYYDRLFHNLGAIAELQGFSEHEQLTLELMQRLATSPLTKTGIYQLGADRPLVDRVIDIGVQGAFIVTKRARGRDILLSPTFFAENADAYADLVASDGAGRVRKVLELLKRNQGWPLCKILGDEEVGGVKLDAADKNVARTLAGDGFISPPAIETTHAGVNHFLFGPRPGPSRLPSFKRPIYEAAMALVAAVRQGQLLPARYRIWSPMKLLNALKMRGYLRASTEAYEQYRKVAHLRVGRLLRTSRDWYRFELIRNPENEEAVDLAITMVSGGEAKVEADEDIILALRQGEAYVESLIGRKRLLQNGRVDPDEETQNAIDEFLLRGAS